MPRRTRRDPRPEGVDEIAGRIVGPAGATVEGYQVRNVVGAKRYRCPWCEGWIEPGTAHVVAFAVGRAEERRHYHTGCWSWHLAAKPRGTR